MRHISLVVRFALSCTLLLVVTGVTNARSFALPYVKAGLVQVDVYDRTSGSALTVHRKDGRYFIVGTPGHEYAVRIRNCTGARVLAVTSVDGVNVITGETAAPSQSGYVLNPWGSVEIIGWRKSLQRTAAFFFTDLRNSYAARTGRPDNVGIIGVAVFREKVRPMTRRERHSPRQQAERQNDAAGADARLESHADKHARAPSPSEHARADELSRADIDSAEKRTPRKLGTGHGRNESSWATVVDFKRSSMYPAETVKLQYDRREKLIAMGVLPLPTPPLARHDPNPFPGAMRFAPDPNP